MENKDKLSITQRQKVKPTRRQISKEENRQRQAKKTLRYNERGEKTNGKQGLTVHKTAT